LIPTPPCDPLLRGTSVAWDGEAIASALNRAFTDRAVRSCEPYYVKYRPEKYCRVQYRIEFQNDDRVVRSSGHVSFYPPRRAEKLAVGHHLSEEGASRSAYIPQLAAIAQLYPSDFGLPGLAEATSPKAMSHRLVPTLAERARKPNDCEIALIRYKAAKRAVLRYRLNGTHTVYGKIRNDGGASLPRIAREFAGAGVPTPRPLAYLRDLKMVVQNEGAGTRLASLRGTAEYGSWMLPVAEALARLHESGIENLPSAVAATEAAELQASAATIAALLPHLGTAARSLARRIVARLSTIDGELTPIHGSFHDDQVLVDATGVTLVDLDGASLGNPLSDVGHFLAYLSAEGADDDYRSFITSYRSLRPGSPDGHLVLESASLLRWATLPFRELREDWPQAVERRVRLASERLDHS
jgi:aminoglycoside phosphotransferase (APT) family kinase protein